MDQVTIDVMRPNLTLVSIGTLGLYFSYETVVAFRDAGEGLVVSENVWSATTGRHLTDIDGGLKKERLDHEQFEDRLEKCLMSHNLRA
jgi:hypothetical protein